MVFTRVSPSSQNLFSLKTKIKFALIMVSFCGLALVI